MTKDWAREKVNRVRVEHMVLDEDAIHLLRLERRRMLRMIAQLIKELAGNNNGQDAEREFARLELDLLRRRLKGEP